MTASAETLDSRVARIETNLEHTATKSDLAELETRLTSELAQVENRVMLAISELERRLIYWALGTAAAIIGGVAAAVRLLG